MGRGKEGSVTATDLEFAEWVCNELCPEAFIGGSFVVKGMSAGDIDVVVPHRCWPALRERLGSMVEKVQRHKPISDEDRPDIDDERLICVYRRGRVDLLVINDDYIESYHKAVSAMEKDPERFQERHARVAIHIFFADEYRVLNDKPLEAEINYRRRTMGHGGSSGDY